MRKTAFATRKPENRGNMTQSNNKRHGSMVKNTGALRIWAGFSAAVSLFVISQFYRASVAVISPHLIRDPGLTPSGLSLLSAAFFYAFAATQVPVGLYLDRIGPRRGMTALSMIAVIGSLIFSLADTVAGLTAGRFLLGVGMACNLMGTLKLVTFWFPANRFGFFSGLVFSLGTVGNIAATTPLVLSVQAFGWRYTFMGFAVFNALLAFLFYIVVSENKRFPENSPSPETLPAQAKRFRDLFHGFSRLFRKRDYWIISLATFCRYGIFAAVQALWAGPFLIMSLSYPPVVAGNILFLMNVGLIAGAPLNGFLSDIFDSRKRVVMFGLFASALVLVALSFLREAWGVWPPTLLFFLFGIFNGSGTMMYAHIKERMPVSMAGTAMTGINFFTMAGAAVFLQGFGFVMDLMRTGNTLLKSDFHHAFRLCALVLFIVCLLYLTTEETSAGRLEKKEPRRCVR
jgi:MFS family permease